MHPVRPFDLGSCDVNRSCITFVTFCLVGLTFSQSSSSYAGARVIVISMPTKSHLCQLLLLLWII